MSAVRALLLASLVLGPAACKRSAATTTPEPTKPEVAGDRAEAGPPPAPTPTEQLTALYLAPVTIAESLSVPDGFVVAFRYDRFEAEIEQLAADGIDVEADIEEAVALCEKERAELDEDQLMWVEEEERSCEEHAVTVVLDDDLLEPGCEALGVAYFDLEGTLLFERLLEDRCLTSLDHFELKDLSPLDDPDIVLVASLELYGQLTRGGWGTVESGSVLHVFAPRQLDGEPVLHEMIQAELDDDSDGGNCPYGNHREIVLADDRALLLYTQGWDDCADEGCIHPDSVEDYDEPVDPAEICTDAPIELERAAWDEGEREWAPFEAVGPWTEDTVLPTGMF